MRKRRLTRRNKSKRNKQLIILSTISLLFIMVAGYAAFNTQLSLKAKGNIKQTSAADMLKKTVVDSGDGLYKDIYEDGRYIYKGANPNNYITFNNETWRVISVEADGCLKIMRKENIGTKSWDSSGSNSWDRPSTLNTYLNDTYLPTITTNADKIVSHTWSIGPVTPDNSDLAEQIKSENETIWTGNVGLVTVSEILKANTNMEQCGTLSLIHNNYETCKLSNWMSGKSNWTITADNSTTSLVFLNSRDGDIELMDAIRSNQSVGALTRILFVADPVIYLSSDTLLSGTGTETDPYIIIN